MKKGTTAFPEFVKAISDEDEILHMYGSETDPINIYDFKLQGDPTDKREYRLTYLTRDNKLCDPFVTSIRTLLSEIKKENNL